MDEFGQNWYFGMDCDEWRENIRRSKPGMFSVYYDDKGQPKARYLSVCLIDLKIFDCMNLIRVDPTDKSLHGHFESGGRGRLLGPVAARIIVHDK